MSVAKVIGQKPYSVPCPGVELFLPLIVPKKPWEKINSFSTSKKRIDTRALHYNDYYVIKKTGILRQMKLNNLLLIT